MAACWLRVCCGRRGRDPPAEASMGADAPGHTAGRGAAPGRADSSWLPAAGFHCVSSMPTMTCFPGGMQASSMARTAGVCRSPSSGEAPWAPAPLRPVPPPPPALAPPPPPHPPPELLRSAGAALAVPLPRPWPLTGQALRFLACPPSLMRPPPLPPCNRERAVAEVVPSNASLPEYKRTELGFSTGPAEVAAAKLPKVGGAPAAPAALRDGSPAGLAAPAHHTRCPCCLSGPHLPSPRLTWRSPPLLAAPPPAGHHDDCCLQCVPRHAHLAQRGRQDLHCQPL